MEHRAIDGIMFEKMMRSGLESLRASEKEINDLNVFPVPDGDTGTNMRRTVELGVETAKTNGIIGDYLKKLSYGMLLGARGNSGVILSQIFKGISKALTRYEHINATNLTAALIDGYITAYASVIRPVEGTILTVIREGIENTKRQVYRKTTVEIMLGIYLSEMKKSLATTPYLLPVLKEAGVVDSGGYGYIKLVEGMLKALYDDGISDGEPVAAETATEPAPIATSAGSKYCLEFLLQLMNNKSPAKRFNVDGFLDEIKKFGDSLVAVRDGSRVRVHVNTDCPEKIMAVCREYGEFVSFELENIKQQNEDFAAAKKVEQNKRAAFAILAVADGDGFAETFMGQGCSRIINGGKTMNTSVKEFLDAYEALNADVVVVLPNDKNIINSAKQAAEMYDGGRIEVIPTADMVQGYYALASDVPDAKPDERISSMLSGIENTIALSVARVSKNSTYKGVPCKTGESAAFINGQIILCEPDTVSAAIKGLQAVEDISEKEQILVFTGKDFTDSDALGAALENAFPQLAVDFVVGGQEADDLILGIF